MQLRTLLNPMSDPIQSDLPEGAVDLARFVRLAAGDVIRRGDVFQNGDGTFLEMDRLGRIFGVQCLGQEIKKSNGWFRPEPNTD